MLRKIAKVAMPSFLLFATLYFIASFMVAADNRVDALVPEAQNEIFWLIFLSMLPLVGPVFLLIGVWLLDKNYLS